MSNLWIIFAVTVLIAVYSAIEVFTNLNHKHNQDLNILLSHLLCLLF